MIIATIISFGSCAPLLFAFLSLLSVIYVGILLDFKAYLPYIAISLLTVTVSLGGLWVVMKIAQPVVLFFPYSFFLPVYWLFKAFNMFPGKTLGTIGLLMSLISYFFKG